MDTTGWKSLDIILWIMIAGFLILRLRGILGLRIGFKRPPRAAQPGQAQPGQAQPREPPVPPAGPAEQPVPLRAAPIDMRDAGPVEIDAATLARMKMVDPSFDPTRFRDGAAVAFGIIVGAFAKGDRAALQPLLGRDIFHAFDQAITERETAGHSQVTEIKAIKSAAIDAAELKGTVATITVKIVSDQRTMTMDKSGAFVSGADATMEITDIWTFERDLARADPTWRLMDSRSG